jgi:hypothetical protein
MGCDEPRFHDAPMLDASILVLRKSMRTMEFVDEWLGYARVQEILTDCPNVSGLANLDGFVDHRHDQAVLSLIAAKHDIQLFRGPSRFGNHAKSPEWRVPGEWLRAPYGADRVYAASLYGTIIDHHRLKSLLVSPGARPSEASYLDILAYCCERLPGPIRILKIGDQDRSDVERLAWRLARVEVAALGSTSSANAWEHLGQRTFGAVICSLPSEEGVAPHGLLELFRRHLLGSVFILCWSDLRSIEGFVRAAALLRSQFGEQLKVHVGTSRAQRGARVRIVGMIRGVAEERVTSPQDGRASVSSC